MTGTDEDRTGPVGRVASAPAVTRVEVEGDDHGGLVVRWELRGETPVDVAVGPSPEAIDHVHAVRGAAGQRSVRLTGLAPGRHFVSVAPAGGGGAMVAGERRLPFAGPTNFRDLGGYPTATGGRTRWGRLFRSDALHRLTPEDLVAFERLGIRSVIDLRSEAERRRAPNLVPSRDLALLEIGGEAPRFDHLRRAADGERWLREQYLHMLAHAGPQFGSLLGGLTEPGGVPAVFHCVAGKDRTGMVAALLLTWLGVDRETVLDDYELTGSCRNPAHDEDVVAWFVEAGAAPDAVAGLLAAPRAAMADTLAVLDRDYGGIEAYLRGPAGLDAAALDRLRQTLIADP